MTEWQPRETAPKDGTQFLAWNPTGETFEIGEWYELYSDEFELIEGTDTYRKVNKKYADGFNCNWFDWWMPLPKAPPSREDTRACTCHPDDNPPKPCPRKYALAGCRAAAAKSSGD